MTENILDRIYTLTDIELVVNELWSLISPYSVITFSGEMGAGKTTFIHHLCDMLQVPDAVSSPTFAIINEYHFNAAGRDNIIYHMDWYRIKSEEELMAAGIEDCMLQAVKDKNYCFIEWPEQAPGMIPKPYAQVKIAVLDEHTRQMKVAIVTK